MKKEYIKKASNILFNSRVKLKKINKLPIKYAPQNMEDSYQIQNLLIKKYLKIFKNNKIIGKKIGCTNKAAQIQINVKEPFYGTLFSKYSSKSNCKINSKNFFSPFIEPEFSFKLKTKIDIKKAPFKSKEIYKYVESVLPSIEIVDSRYTDWTTVGINHLIADNAVNAHWIYGDEINNLDLFNFNNHPVELKVNNKKYKGNSKKVLNNPINSLTWLINKLATQGVSLPSKTFISTGTCTPAISISINDKICADFGKLGKVNFTYI